MPVGIKDIIDTAGVLTTQGSSFFPDNVPAEDAECVRKLKEAGAVVVGKCNTHEFAAGSTTVNPHYGPRAQPLESRAGIGRFERRLGRCGGGLYVSGCGGNRHGRLHPGACERMRHDGPEAHTTAA